MPSKLRAYLQLVRLPNLFTAAADIFAGFFYCGGQLENWPILLRLSLASMCLYAGGVALNDVCDAPRDAQERPERPIPSGRIPLGTALRLSVTLLIVGIALAATVSLQSAAIALALTITITLYDFVWKQTFIAPAIMGTCRGLNMALGMYAATQWTASLAPWLPVVIIWLYITSVTAFARTESRESDPYRLALSTIGMCLAVTSLFTIRQPAPDTSRQVLVWLAAALLVWIAYNGLAAAFRRTPAVVQRSTKRFILSLILLDACIAGSAGPLSAALTASLLAPTIILARKFRIT